MAQRRPPPALLQPRCPHPRPHQPPHCAQVHEHPPTPASHARHNLRSDVATMETVGVFEGHTSCVQSCLWLPDTSALSASSVFLSCSIDLDPQVTCGVWRVACDV
jgi:hypothetical protein